MKYLFVSVGKDRDGIMDAGITEFTLRLSRYVPTEWRVVKQSERGSTAGPAVAIKEEASDILKVIESSDTVIVLDEHGKEFSSRELAQILEKKIEEGVKRTVFVIGGAYGVSDEVKSRANLTWSFSKLTFPHQLARLILCESVYRAHTIIRGEKYHHG